MQAIRTGIILRQIEPQKTTAGGLILTQNHGTTYGEVVSVGSEVDKAVSVGAQVVVNWNAAVQIPHENDTYFVVDQSSVFAVV
jgi:co-chaperonin GroES (HSP10)